ncbi:conserved hypothetical protein [Vibrio crassostreae]|uniref:hypothetical protein n=1 Tax=Vibrio crassostreae TaxID=246167 RepID=UPI0010631962|nr:hypothetical protein [Vibrio crassostreae]TDW07881.1 hypothetical protein EDB45_11591 [Vibrio crassostreae]CAK1713499.1 conserved hypothetical protein [Vibrio crassostreae]CAK1735207.1 conserved hypothetical protein [Vibrio crassostreae]CAK1755917.1 conserved hypothetical protein [Vibrio crassostreae]CAK1783339.1 conserved hypothetical protein [Vibrio crassostreae]
MALRLVGTIAVNINVDGEYQEAVISASDFGLEEADMRHIGGGDYQYEALYVYYEGDIEISFQATNFQGSVSQYPFSTSGDIEILEDNLSVEAIDYDPDDYF